MWWSNNRRRLAGSLAAVVVPIVVFAATPTAGTTAEVPEKTAWVWPVPIPRQVLRPFEAPPTPYAAGHRGIDVPAVKETQVFAVAAGVVDFAGVVVDRPVLSLRHADGLVSSIEPVNAAVDAGDIVSAGDRVGVVAGGGHCDGRCVHFGVRLYGEYINPMALLGSVSRSVLLPLGR